MALLVVLLAGSAGVWSASPGAAFDEVFELLRKNLAGVSEAELQEAATSGLIEQLYPHVSLVTNQAAGTNVGRLANTSVIEGAYGLFRFGEVGEGIEKEFESAYKRIGSSNRLKGVVLDLRFADGTDYAAAVALADGFFSKRRPLADWGDGVRFSTEKADAVELPLAILVNGETRGSAEAFAGILRRSDVGVVIGDATAGQASISREFTLKDGRKLRVATTPVKLAGAAPIDRKGLKPDIEVKVSPGEERAFLQDAYRVTRTPVATGTNLVAGTNRPRRRLTEADLVRMQREGADLESDVATGREAGPNRPAVITDPALARAVDLLKGLSVVQQFRSF